MRNPEMSPELLGKLHAMHEIIAELTESTKRAKRERDTHIFAAYNAGHTLRAISAEVGLSFKQVQRSVIAAQSQLLAEPRPEHTPEADTADEAAPMVLKLLDDPAGVAAPIDLTGYTKRVEADGSVYWTPLQQQDGRVRKPKNEIYESTANEPRPPLQPKRFR